MLARDLEQYLHAQIPLCRAMRVQVAALDAQGVTLSAPLAPNINHHETVFGGSAAVLAILAGWSLIHVRLQHAQLPARVVIQRHTMEYERPMAQDFKARSALESEDAWAAFAALLARRGRARLRVLATLECAGVRSGSFSGQFVAVSAQNE